MIERLNSIKEKSGNRIKLAKKYEMSPSIRGLVQLIPFGIGSAIHEYLTAVIDTDLKFEKIHHSKEEFNDSVISELEAQPKSLRAIIVGPHFLHPDCFIERRINKENRQSFSLALRTYLEKSLNMPDRDIRLIIRNNDRYLKYLEDFIKFDEIDFLIKEMNINLNNIINDKSIKICCKDVGFFDGVIITEESYYKYARTSEFTPIESFYQSKDPQKIEMEKAHFDKTFNANYKGKDNEIATLKSYIMSLKNASNFFESNKV